MNKKRNVKRFSSYILMCTNISKWDVIKNRRVSLQNNAQFPIVYK